MNRLYRSLACAVLLLAPPAHLAAQSLPVILQSEMGKKGAPQAFQNLNDFAQCVVKHGKSDAAVYLSADFPPKHVDTGAAFLADNYGFCLRGTFLLALTATYMRGALIEAEYHQFARDGVSLRLGKLSSSDSPWSTAVADCLVTARPEIAEALLSTTIASSQQAAALAAFGDKLSACARAAGATEISSELLRYEIAEVLYRRKTEPKPAMPQAVTR